MKIEFETAITNEVIQIPEQYRSLFPDGTKVWVRITMKEDEQPNEAKPQMN